MYSMRVDLFHKAGQVKDLKELYEEDRLMGDAVLNLLQEVVGLKPNRKTFQFVISNQLPEVEWSLESRVTARALAKRFKSINLVGVLTNRDKIYSKIVELDIKKLRLNTIEEDVIDDEYAERLKKIMQYRSTGCDGILQVLLQSDGNLSVKNIIQESSPANRVFS